RALSLLPLHDALPIWKRAECCSKCPCTAPVRSNCRTMKSRLAISSRMRGRSYRCWPDSSSAGSGGSCESQVRYRYVLTVPPLVRSEEHTSELQSRFDI